MHDHLVLIGRMKTNQCDHTTEGSVQADPEGAVVVAIYKDVSSNELLL